MNLPAANLPLSTTHTPGDQAELAALVGEAHATGTPVYPLGGQTSLAYGMPATRPGWGLSLAGLSRVVDYPARDLTVTVEAGITLARLAELLAGEKQRLPLDVPRAAEATLGGVVAANWNGPRRYGLGTVRDYVIGIHAVDGRGTPFKGGGRVVKNVAGYDFCKLLTGSLGTLGVITQLTLKVKPVPERFALLACGLPGFAEAERLLTSLVNTQTTPAAIELVGGPAWRGEPALGPLLATNKLAVAVAFEGTAPDVAWQLAQLEQEWRGLGLATPLALAGNEADSLWQALVEFPAAGNDPLVLKGSMVPSHVGTLLQAALAIDAQVSFQAHAGSGIVLLRFPTFPAAGLSRTLVGSLQPVAAAGQGHMVILTNAPGQEFTRHSVWGPAENSWGVMHEIKRQFDPLNLLNPGRFIFA